MLRDARRSVRSHRTLTLSLPLAFVTVALVACSGDAGESPGGDGTFGGSSSGSTTPGPSAPTGPGPKLDCGGGPCVVTSMAMGTLSACVLLADETVACYGGGVVGTLGRGEVVDGDPFPKRVKDLTGAKAIWGGAYNYCAANAAGELFCWGADQSANAFSLRPGALEPKKIEGLSGVTQVGISLSHTCAVASEKVYCWGDNSYGELGDGTFDSRADAREVQGLDGVAQVTLGHGFTCARKTTGEVVCWGFNNDGQLGTADEGHPLPEPVPDVSGAIEIGASTGLNLQPDDPDAQKNATSVCALVEGGTVTCWGKRWKGPIADVSDAKQLRVSWTHACVLRGDGKITCWGDNARGQLGNGSYGDGRTGPSEVQELAGPDLLVSSGNSSCGVFAEGWIGCWGDNKRGQLGDGTTDNIRPVPVKVRL